MRRPPSPARPICPMCEQEGVHGSAEACIAALRVAIDRYVRRLSHLPPATFLARWTAYGATLQAAEIAHGDVNVSPHPVS